MFNPLNDPNVQAWFQRLDTAWRRMPDEERTRQREEVLQHLETLVAANVAQDQPLDAAWSAALVQFGDPTQIGRKICGEWKLSRTGFRAEMAAIGFGMSFQLALKLLGASAIITGIPLIGYFAVYLAGSLAAPIFVGRKYPRQAIKATLYSSLAWNVWLVVMYHTSLAFLVRLLLIICFQLMLAYLASVTKRGWYKPTLGDFKLTLPKRRMAR